MKMVRIILIAFIFATSYPKANAQITQDTVYPTTALRLWMVDLEISGMKFLVKSSTPGDRFLKLYNLNHSLWKTVDCDSFPVMTYCAPVAPQYNFTALYVSETLFDCDPDLEFMYICTSDCRWYTGIYKENGTPLFLGDSLAPLVAVTIPQHQRPIYNTPVGTKMILSHRNGDGIVYDLPCELSIGIDQMTGEGGELSEMNVFPNPSYYETTIAYTLPPGVNEARLVISDMNGNEVKTYNVDRTFSSLLISTNELAAGTYFYSLVDGNHVLAAKKIIVLSK